MHSSSCQAVAMKHLQCEEALEEAPIVAYRVLPMHDSLFASGDEDGLIRTWDWRTKNRVGEYSSHTDFISDMAYHDADSCLAAASGDGSLSINDTRTQTVSALAFTLLLQMATLLVTYEL